MTGPLTNWAGNITFGASSVSRPGSAAELQQVVAASPRVRALGTGHSFSDVADTGGVLVSVAGLPRVLELDRDRAQVTVSAGLRYGELASWLHERGWALANLGSLPHISVAGACATGTHGSGDGNPCLAAAVAGAELVTAGGESSPRSTMSARPISSAAARTEIRVEPDPERLAVYGVTLSQLIDKLTNANRCLPRRRLPRRGQVAFPSSPGRRSRACPTSASCF